MRITRLAVGFAAMLAAGAMLPSSALAQTPSFEAPFDDRPTSVVWRSAAGPFDSVPATSRQQPAAAFSLTASSALRQREQPGVGWAVLGATAGSLLGAAAGVGVGALIEAPSEGSVAPFWGAIVGSTVGAPVGAHLANGRRGNLLYSALGTAVAMPVAGYLGAYTLDVVGVMVAVPLAQIGTATVIERVTSR